MPYPATSLCLSLVVHREPLSSASFPLLQLLGSKAQPGTSSHSLLLPGSSGLPQSLVYNWWYSGI